MESAGEKSPPEQVWFELEGEYWTLTYRGRLVRLRDSAGLQYLSYLLRHPGEPVDCTVLLKAAGRNDAPSQDAARSSVTKRIRDAIDKISSHHPSLGHHLSTCIHTGHECRYITDPERPVTWSF